MHDVLGLILGGGRGARLYPLTQKRSKPAVPLAGKYRLIDIPISNCLHAGIEKIFILTQFNSVSLHRHIHGTYVRDMFSRGWIEVLAAQQTLTGSMWYQGTADAVRQQFHEILNARTKYVLILAGDHLYQMDYRKFVAFHCDAGADITLAVQPVSADHASGLGILKCDRTGKLVDYHEKPLREELPALESMPDSAKPLMASMGIFVISAALLQELLREPGNDFAKDMMPRAITKYRVMGYVFDGYWADIGTIRRFYEANLEMASPNPPFSLNNPDRQIYTHPRFLPPCEVYGATLEETLLTDGCRIYDAVIKKSVIGLRSMIGPKTNIQATVLMGADYYESAEARADNLRRGRPDIGIGEGTHIEGALIDKNARIGKHVRIRHVPDRSDSECGNWVVRDGLVIIPKGAVIPDETVI